MNSQYTQHPPYCVSLCLSTGCNLHCDFCGITSTQTGPSQNKTFMTWDTAEKIATSIGAAGWNCRIEIGAYGESFLNPAWSDIIAVLREHNPKSQIMGLTNGGPFMKGDVTKNVLKFFESGGTKLGIEKYKHVKIYEKLMAKIDLDIIRAEGIDVRRYPEDKEGNPHLKDHRKCLIMIDDLRDNAKGTHSVIINMAGSAGELSFKRESARCAHPFRKLIFRSSGEVPVCCNDWMGEFTVGSIHKSSIEEIWHSDLFYAAREVLYAGRRDLIRPCSGCDAVTYRNGLLPDGKGTRDLIDPMVSERSLSIIRKATKAGPQIPVTEVTKARMMETLPKEFVRQWTKAKTL